MARRQIDSYLGCCANLFLIVLGLVSCSMVYVFLSTSFRPTITRTSSFDLERKILVVRESEREREREREEEEGGGGGGECCRGMDHLELWGNAVKWGADFKVKSSKECCGACKEMCNGGGECLCDSWVFCGDRQACGSKFGECWLKKQKDSLDPDRVASDDKVVWTSGLIFGIGEGIVGLETNYGVMRIELFPDCAPYSVAYVLELLASRHCAGCQFYRAETRGDLWDSGGNHNENAPFGPPYALIQGTLEARGTEFKNIPREDCPRIRRGSVAWVRSGPDFFISLANHNEWRNTYTVFGSVLAEDMEVAEKIAQLPTRQDVWNNVNVAVLENPILLRFQRIKRSKL